MCYVKHADYSLEYYFSSTLTMTLNYIMFCGLSSRIKCYSPKDYGNDPSLGSQYGRPVSKHAMLSIHRFWIIVMSPLQHIKSHALTAPGWYLNQAFSIMLHTKRVELGSSRLGETNRSQTATDVVMVIK